MIHFSEPDVLKFAGVEVLKERFLQELRIRSRESLLIPERGEVETEGEYGVWMPVCSPLDGIFIVKSGIVLKTPRPDIPTVSSAIVVYDITNNVPLCTIDGLAILNARTAGISAVALSCCTNNTYKIAAIIGAGVQARQQLNSLSTLPSIAEVRIYSRDPVTRRIFIDAMRKSLKFGFTIVDAPSLELAVEGADIICTATTSSKPLKLPIDINSRFHINCIGAHALDTREVSLDILRNSVVIVESNELANSMTRLGHECSVDMEDAIIDSSLYEKNTVFSSFGHAYYDYLTVKEFLKITGII